MGLRASRSQSPSRFTDSTSSAITEITVNLESTGTLLDELDQVVRDASAAAEEITENIGSLNEQVGNQSAAVTQSSSAVEQMMASIGNIAASSQARRDAGS